MALLLLLQSLHLWEQSNHWYYEIRDRWTLRGILISFILGVVPYLFIIMVAFYFILQYRCGFVRVQCCREQIFNIASMNHLCSIGQLFFSEWRVLSESCTVIYRKAFLGGLKNKQTTPVLLLVLSSILGCKSNRVFVPESEFCLETNEMSRVNLEL